LRTAEEKGDWLPAPGPLNLAERFGGRVPVPFFRAPAGREPL
jgi:hypothetical protein